MKTCWEDSGMSDLAVSLLAVVAAAAIAGTILLTVQRARKARTAALAAFCSDRGYTLDVVWERLGKELTVTADDWRLVSSMRSAANEAQAGSSEWQMQTEWVSERKNPNRPVFALYCAGGSGEIDALPAWVRAAALEKIKREIGGAADALGSARTVFAGRGATGVVFEPEAMSAQPAVERLEPILSVWREKTPLCIECSPERMRLRLPGFYIGTAERLDAVLRIGTALE